MRVLLFGATGLVGRGALRECLLDPAVESVVTVTRSPVVEKHPKLHSIVQSKLGDLSPHREALRETTACFFCLGTSALGMSEQDYRRVTYDLALSIASFLVTLNPAMTFIFISGGGADSTEKGPIMWARIKGQTENALLRLPFQSVYVFRPGYVQPLHGIASKTRWHSILQSCVNPIAPQLGRWFPRHVTTTEKVGRALIAIAKRGSPLKILDNVEINRAASH